jgi:hypothetical protein
VINKYLQAFTLPAWKCNQENGKLWNLHLYQESLGGSLGQGMANYGVITEFIECLISICQLILSGFSS